MTQLEVSKYVEELLITTPANQLFVTECIVTLMARFPTLSLITKWGCPMLSYNGHNIAFFIIKKEFEKTKFKSPQVFLGVPHGNVIMNLKIFEPSKLLQVRYINLTKRGTKYIHNQLLSDFTVIWST
jgi:hypothetical protein